MNRGTIDIYRMRAEKVQDRYHFLMSVNKDLANRFWAEMKKWDPDVQMDQFYDEDLLDQMQDNAKQALTGKDF